MDKTDDVCFGCARFEQARALRILDKHSDTESQLGQLILKTKRESSQGVGYKEVE